MPKTKALLFLGFLAVVVVPKAQADDEACRPDGLYKSAGNVPYCLAYDAAGREKMAIPRRIIGYFPAWRHGQNGQPRYLVKDIPFGKITHINYAFGHIENNRLSVGPASLDNPATGMTWPGVAGAEMDPAFPYNGHFNLLSKLKRQFPQVKTLISVGGWAETGGYFDPAGRRVANGGFYTLVDSAANINTFADSAVAFLRQYNFDGVDIDFEYATSANFAGNPDDFAYSQARRATLMTGYVNLMRTLRQKLDAASIADGRYYRLTAAVSASGWILRGSEAYQVTEFLDFANVMSYDLHGAWNHFVGPNAALYDDGQDAELAQWNVYGVYGIGYLNTDWAYHYFRASMPAGRINIGVPYYTRGWRGVTGGVNGLWGRAALPNQSQCPPGTGSSVGSTTPCGNGAVGIDNLWHDKNLTGGEVPAGANPMWHAKNLERGIQGSYLTQFGLDPVNNPEHRMSGTYQRFNNSTLVAPWLWNASKSVFLSIEDEQSLAVKADYVVNKGIGGVMFWELSADYNCPASGECGMGEAMTTVLHNKLRTASPYGASKAGRTLPSTPIHLRVTVGGYPVGDSNYPITPRVTITNNSGMTIPGGAVFEFDYATSCMPATLADQSGVGTTTVITGHSGNNTGAPGLRGDFHHARFTLPSWMTIAAGASTTITMTHPLPTSIFSNWTVAFGGTTYVLATDWPRTSGAITPTPRPATPTPTATPVLPTPTPTPTGSTPRPTPTPTPTDVVPRPTPTPTPTPAQSTSYEAEGGTIAGAVRRSACGACSGQQKVGFLGNGAANTLTMTVSSAVGGSRPVTLHYLVSGTRTLSYRVNGGAAASVALSGTSFQTVATRTLTLALNAGSNTLVFFNNSAYAPDLDRLVIGAGVPTPTPTPTATPGTPPTPTAPPAVTPSPTPTAPPVPTPTPTPGGSSEWRPNIPYAVGDVVTYQGQTYRCRQPHTSLVTWEPPNVPALWLKL